MNKYELELNIKETIEAVDESEAMNEFIMKIWSLRYNEVLQNTTVKEIDKEAKDNDD